MLTTTPWETYHTTTHNLNFSLTSMGILSIKKKTFQALLLTLTYITRSRISITITESILQGEGCLSNGVTNLILDLTMKESLFSLLGLILRLFVQIGKMARCSITIMMGFIKSIQQLIWFLIYAIPPNMIIAKVIKKSINSCQTLTFKFGHTTNTLTSANTIKDQLQKDSLIKIKFFRRYSITIHQLSWQEGSK